MSTEEKQNFLREKILEKGYDVNEFVEFLTQKKGEEGADVSNWSMEDLKIVVNEFIKIEEEKKKPKKIKVSMFDVLGSSKTSTKKSQSQPLQNQQNKPQLEIKKPQNSQNLSNTKPQTQVQQKIQKSPESYNINNNNNLTGGESDYGIIIPDKKDCKPLETTELSKFDKFEITVGEPRKEDGGFFSKNYAT